MKITAVSRAAPRWNEQGTPVSEQFDDVYFSSQDGLGETEYVFLNGNGLPSRFTQHPRELFITAETGFGTGLNFLMLWQAFDRFCQQEPDAKLRRLHFISCEKFPLAPDDLATAHGHWPQLASYARALREQWPPALAGCHRLLFDGGRVTLDLWLGDINELIHTFDDTLDQQVDAWFLDGFAPSKNPEMWTDALFDCMARLARPGATLATFTAAGFVKRGLRQAGFEVSKRKGFGKKREMLIGHLPQARQRAARTPWYARPAARGEDIALIGGGIASALLANALLRRGKRVTLYSAASAPAEGASGNRQGALYPLLNNHDPALASFFPLAFSFARRLLDSLAFDWEHDWCGVTQLGWDEKSRDKIDKMLAMNLPAEIAQNVDKDDVDALCGVQIGLGGIHYPAGGWLCPAELTAALLAQACSNGLTLHWQYELTEMTAQQNGWQLNFSQQPPAHHANVVLCNGHRLTGLVQSEKLPAYAVAGQVSHIPTSTRLSALRQVLCYDGYLTPVSSRRQQHCIGASYHRGDSSTDYREEDQHENRVRLLHCLPEADWARDVDVSAGSARCGVRCATRDHLPLIGALPDYDRLLEEYSLLAEQQDTAASAPVHDGVFVLGALGSRGLCSGPLAAEILAAQLCGEPIPLDHASLAATSPNRYWVRKLLKGRPVR